MNFPLVLNGPSRVGWRDRFCEKVTMGRRFFGAPMNQRSSERHSPNPSRNSSKQFLEQKMSGRRVSLPAFLRCRLSLVSRRKHPLKGWVLATSGGIAWGYVLGGNMS